MTARHALALAISGWLAVLAVPAAAERIIISLSSHRVLIKSDFTGEELVVFGTIETDEGAVPRQRNHEIVVTVTGPKQTMVTRRKERVFGIWVNADSRTFVQVPSYLAVLSTRPVEEIANAEILRRLQIGLENTLLPQQIGPDLADVPRRDPLRAAFLRLRQADRFYLEDPKGVTLLTPSLYRATIPLPATVRVGTYDVDIKLFEGGAMVGRAQTALEVTKVGFEQFVANAAQNYGVLYGLVTVFMALGTGWLAAIAFRKD